MVQVEIDALMLTDHGRLNQKDDNENQVDYQGHLLSDLVNHFHSRISFSHRGILKTKNNKRKDEAYSSILISYLNIRE